MGGPQQGPENEQEFNDLLYFSQCEQRLLFLFGDLFFGSSIVTSGGGGSGLVPEG